MILAICHRLAEVVEAVVSRHITPESHEASCKKQLLCLDGFDETSQPGVGGVGLGEGEQLRLL